MSLIEIVADKPNVVPRIPGGSEGDDVLDDKGEWGKLKVRNFAFRKVKDGVNGFPAKNYARGEMDEITSIKLECSAKASNIFLPYFLSSPFPQNFDASAILEEYVECRWEPSDRFVNDPTTTAKVVVRHAAMAVVSATLVGDPEEYSQQMSAEATLALEQFGKRTNVPIYIQASGKAIQITEGSETQLSADGSVSIDRTVGGTVSGDTSGSGSASATVGENVKLGGSGQVSREDTITKSFTRNGADPIKKKDQIIATGSDEDDLGHNKRNTKRFAVRVAASVGSSAAGPENLSQTSLTLQGSWECRVEIYQAGQLVALLLPGADGATSATAIRLAQLRTDILTLAELGTPLIVAARALGVPDGAALSAVLAANPLPRFVSKTRTWDEMLGLRAPVDEGFGEVALAVGPPAEVRDGLAGVAGLIG
jgi:hypothetical protein